MGGAMKYIQGQNRRHPAEAIPLCRVGTLGATRRRSIDPYRPAAAAGAKYVRMMSAPARRMAVNDSHIARGSSSIPRSAAALIIAYSPLT